jgi:hypothetical protein
MSHVEISADRHEHPLDVIERLAAGNEWVYERSDDDEISIGATGSWSEYEVAFTWLPQLEALHVACAFDLKVPPPRRAEVMQLVALANERLWVGHFDLWSSENVVMFRHSLLLTGGTLPSGRQAEGLMRVAIETCDKHFQAFQFVVWAGRSARDSLDSALMETLGEA